MQVVFAHDHIFYKYKNDFYSNGGLSAKALSRYTEVFEKLIILSRQEELKQKDEMLSLASLNNTDFVKVPNFKSGKTLKNIFKAEEIIENTVSKCDCLIARLPSAIGAISIKYAKKYDKQYLIEMVGCPFGDMWYYGSFIGKILAPIEYIKYRKILKKADRVIYVTSRFLQGRYPCPQKTTNCSNVSVVTGENIVLENRLKKIDEYSNNRPLKIGMIGALSSANKGFDVAIKALSNLKRNNINIEIHFLGKGDPSKLHKQALELGVEDYVFFDGFLPSGDAVLRWIDELDIYIQLSKIEGLPRATIEAMSRACPVIATDVSGLPELVDPDCLIKKSDFKRFSEIIITKAFDKEWLIEKATVNFEKAKKYDIKTIAKKRYDFLRNFRASI